MTDLPYNDILHYLHLSDSRVRKIPELGNWISRTGHVVNILATPSGAGAQVWVEGFFYAAPKLVWLFAKPFLQAEEWYRFLNAHCGKKRKGKIADFARALGISDEGAIPTKGLPGPVRAVFSVTIDLSLKAEWYFFIADQVTEFAYNWTSLVYQWQGDEVFTEPHARGYTDYHAVFQDGGEVLRAWGFTDQYIMQGYASGILVPAGIGASVSYALTSLPGPGPDSPACSISTQLVDSDGTILSDKIDSTPFSGGEQVSDVYFYQGEQRENLQNWGVKFWNNSPKYIPYVQGNFQAYGTRVGKKGVFFDP